MATSFLTFVLRKGAGNHGCDPEVFPRSQGFGKVSKTEVVASTVAGQRVFFRRANNVVRRFAL